jgi:hypothetical protein
MPPILDQNGDVRQEADDENPDPASRRLEHYATPEEITATIAAIREKWKQLGRELKTAKQAVGDLWRQPGETNSAWYARYLTMTEEQQRLWEVADGLQHKRSCPLPPDRVVDVA